MDNLETIVINGRHYIISEAMGPVAYQKFLHASPKVQEIALKILEAQIRDFENTPAECKRSAKELQAKLQKREKTSQKRMPRPSDQSDSEGSVAKDEADWCCNCGHYSVYYTDLGEDEVTKDAECDEGLDFTGNYGKCPKFEPKSKATEPLGRGGG